MILNKPVKIVVVSLFTSKNKNAGMAKCSMVLVFLYYILHKLFYTHPCVVKGIFIMMLKCSLIFKDSALVMSHEPQTNTASVTHSSDHLAVS